MRKCTKYVAKKLNWQTCAGDGTHWNILFALDMQLGVTFYSIIILEYVSMEKWSKSIYFVWIDGPGCGSFDSLRENVTKYKIKHLFVNAESNECSLNYYFLPANNMNSHFDDFTTTNAHVFGSVERTSYTNDEARQRHARCGEWVRVLSSRCQSHGMLRARKGKIDTVRVCIYPFTLLHFCWGIGESNLMCSCWPHDRRISNWNVHLFSYES